MSPDLIIQSCCTGRCANRFPMTNQSTSVRRKQRTASWGVHTIGSCTLNEVFKSTGTPVRRLALDEALHRLAAGVFSTGGENAPQAREEEQD